MNPIIWLALSVVLIIVEALTVGLVCIWFACGAVVAFICGLLGLGEVGQIVVFLGVSIVALVLTRPLAKKIQSKHEKTNVDMLIGQTAIVTVDIDNVSGVGEAKVGGRVWTARSADGELIAKDEKVKIESIEGVKIIVSR